LNIFKKSVKNFTFHENLTGITSILHKDLCSFWTVSHSVLLRKRQVSGKSCRKYQNKFYVQEFFPKIVPFMRLCGNIW